MAHKHSLLSKKRLRLLIWLGILWILYILTTSYSIPLLQPAPLIPSTQSIYFTHDENFIKAQQDDELTQEQIDKKKHKHSKTAKCNFTDDATFLMLKSTFISRDERNITDQHSTIYDEIFDNHKTEAIFGLSFKERCDLYFKNLFIKDHNWKFEANRNWDINYETEDFKNFKETKHAKFKEEFDRKDEDHEDYSKALEEFIKKKYESIVKKPVIEQEVIDYVSAIRIFNKCYITNENKTQINQMSKFIYNQHQIVESVPNAHQYRPTRHEALINDLDHFEHRLYPWLSFDYPIYEHWTGKTFHRPPNLKRLAPAQQNNHKRTTGSFLKLFEKLSNGKGIVLSIPEAHVDSTMRLIHLLRALNNQLPIQIIYHDNLSNKAKQKLVTAAREEYIVLPQSFKRVAKYFPKDYETNGLPKQDIWFVNVNNAIHDHYKEKFQRWANKLLAVMFNSFEEFMLIDDDTVLLQHPERYFFNLPGYKSSGAYFYKDRNDVTRRSEDELNFFKRLTPNIVDSLMFNIPIITNHSLSLEAFKGLYYFQEAGVVMLNRKVHFHSILMILQLNFLGPIAGKLYGEKELFWLGFTINGDESFEFNKNFVASVGEPTPQPNERARPDGTPHNSQEICSAHPGHIANDNHTLVWMNSGFRVCHYADEIDFEEEFKKRHKYKSIPNQSAFQAFYHSPLRISHAIIPPLDPGIKDRLNIEDEPTSGWMMDDHCRNYLWCGYSSIGGKVSDDSDEDNTLKGTLIEFDQWERDLFTYYGDVWVGEE